MSTYLGSLARLFEAPQNGSSLAFATVDSTTTWKRAANDFARLVADGSRLRGQRVALLMRPTSASFVALAALERLGARTFLIDSSLDESRRVTLLQQYEIKTLINPVAHSSGDSWHVEQQGVVQDVSLQGEATVTLLTSGTSGKPKAVTHTWKSLMRPVRIQADREPPAWLLSYRPNLYAGLQVCAQCLANRGLLVMPGHNLAPDQIMQLMSEHGVRYASATPSYWRRLLLLGRAAIKELKLKQVTCGGETADQTLLDWLKQSFPHARIVHIYATSELGRCFAIDDGLAGFPVRMVNTPTSDGIEIRVERGQLFARSANSMKGYERADAAEKAMSSDGWFATGDLVDKVNDRYQFVGRTSEIINVGGDKVHPLQVEQVIYDVPGVAATRVYPKTSSLAGQLVACDIVPGPGEDVAELERRVNKHCVQRLLPHSRPRFIRAVSRIELSAAGKIIRRHHDVQSS